MRKLLQIFIFLDKGHICCVLLAKYICGLDVWARERMRKLLQHRNEPKRLAGLMAFAVKHRLIPCVQLDHLLFWLLNI